MTNAKPSTVLAGTSPELSAIITLHVIYCVVDSLLCDIPRCFLPTQAFPILYLTFLPH